MPRYVVIHGGVHKGGKHALAGSKLEDGTPGDRVELEESEAKQIDPRGDCLVLEATYEAGKKGDKEKARLIAEANATAEKAKPQHPKK